MKGIVAAVLVVCAVLGLFLARSGRLKTSVEASLTSASSAYDAAKEAVAKNPAIHDPVKFSGEQETSIERWDQFRWRISGYVDSEPKKGTKVRTLYFCVMRYSGERWDVEDMQLQSMEFPGGGARP